MRKSYLSDEYLINYIDDVVLYLGDAVDRNFDKWGYTFNEEHDLLTPTSRNPRNYEEAVAQLKSTIVNRGNYMDENINHLYRYCHESINKKYNYN